MRLVQIEKPTWLVYLQFRSTSAGDERKRESKHDFNRNMCMTINQITKFLGSLSFVNVSIVMRKSPTIVVDPVPFSFRVDIPSQSAKASALLLVLKPIFMEYVSPFSLQDPR